MAKFDLLTIIHWTDMVDVWLSKNYGITDRFGITERSHVTDATSAWTIAHRSGITEEAYADRSVVDAHIVTALKQLFPNANYQGNHQLDLE
jgi:hypothetical protein